MFADTKSGACIIGRMPSTNPVRHWHLAVGNNSVMSPYPPAPGDEAGLVLGQEANHLSRLAWTNSSSVRCG